MADTVVEKWQHLTRDLADYVQFMKEEGTTHVEAPAEVLSKPVPQPRSTSRMSPSSNNQATPVSATAVGGEGDELSRIAARVAECRLCGLCETRKQTVPGQGARRPELIFVGEGPGADEDEQGQAFVGRAGQLLTKMIEAMGFSRDEVWIGNIVKCRPPNNRVPTAEEMAACMPYLKEQIALLQPKVIVCLGATAVKGLLNPSDTISKVRGNWMSFEGIDTMPTFHPAYLLRNPPAKKFVWADLKAVLERLGRPVPSN